MAYKLNRDEEGLTEKERTVLALMREHNSMASVARELVISRERVRQIVRQIEAKAEAQPDNP